MMKNMRPVDFGNLTGKTLLDIDILDDDKIIFTTVSGITYEMFHEQDCCESVYIEDICGDLIDLLGEPILLAEVVTDSDGHPPVVAQNEDEYIGHFTWTFYKLATIKGSVTIRWFGKSSGYYSEKVNFFVVE